MERTITFTVDASGGVTPTAPQYAGVQGEHNACRVVFAVAAWATEEFHYRGEFVSGDGAGGSTDELPVKNGQVSFLLPAAWTAAGGRAVVRLVASVLVNGEEEQTVFAVDAPVYFAAKQELGAEIRATEMAGLAGLIQTVQDTVADVEDRLARDAFKGDKGDTGPVGPKGDPWVYIGSGEMPEGYDVQIDPDGDATTDATLCIAGYPADAKATGDRLAQKLDADALDDAVEQALQEAKESGAFKGDPGEDAVLNEFELITSGETTEEVNKIVITKDNDGNPLALRDMMTVYMYIPKAESDTAVTVTLNSVLTHQIASAISSSSAKYAKAVLLFTGGHWEPFSLQGASTASQTSWIGRNVTPFYGPENKNTVSGITLFIYDTSLVFPVGTKYQIYGRRV